MKKTLIIAEAGVNHNGNMDTAYRLIDAAVEAGADFVKFQTWKSEHMISRCASKAPYQKETTGADQSMLEMEQQLELPFKNFIYLKEYCCRKGIGFLSSPFDIESLRFLYTMGVPLMKIPSGEITNLPYLEVVAGYPCPVLLSTGMSGMEEVEAAVAVLKSGAKKDIVVLHCNTQYPTPMQDVNLRAIRTLKECLGLPAGLSDHTAGIEVPIAAVALGAEVIEKHLTLDRNMNGPDHRASIEPEAFKKMVESIRNIEMALGSGHKQITQSELENLTAARKSIVAAKKITKGEVFHEYNLAVKRPGTGLSPMRWYELLGRQAQHDFEEDEIISHSFE